MHEITTNLRLVLIYMNLAHNVYIHIVGGRQVNIGILRAKINSLRAMLNPICPLLTLFGTHDIFRVAG